MKHFLIEIFFRSPLFSWRSVVFICLLLGPVCACRNLILVKKSDFSKPHGEECLGLYSFYLLFYFSVFFERSWILLFSPFSVERVWPGGVTVSRNCIRLARCSTQRQRVVIKIVFFEKKKRILNKRPGKMFGKLSHKCNANRRSGMSFTSHYSEN